MRFVWCVLVCAMAACGPGVRPAPPADTASASALPALDAPLSRFNVPLSYDFSPILRIVEHAVPMKFGFIPRRDIDHGAAFAPFGGRWK